jgi:uncharacterized membrane protein YedE/YeeE
MTLTVTSIAPLIAACLLAFVLGFAAHRASVCTVRGIAEFMHARTGHMMWSIAKSALFVMALAIPILLLTPASAQGISGWQLTGWAVAGGFLFGIGAAINGACAYGIMTRMVDGEGAQWIGVIGFGLGVVAFVFLLDLKWVPRPTPTSAQMKSLLPFGLAIGCALIAYALYEIARLWRSCPEGTTLRQRILAPQYRLSTAALLMGLASAVILLIYGSPGYTTTFQQSVEGVRGSRPFPAIERIVLLLAVLAGMVASTLQRGSFQLDARPRVVWLRNLVGGGLMGFGTALAPGGNDALVLYGVPTVSPHALPTVVTMLIGIVLGLAVMKALFGLEMRVACRNDVYIGDTAAKIEHRKP